MAEEFQGSLSSFNTWASLRCNDLFSCSAALNSCDTSGSFGCFPATADTFELSNNSPLFSSVDLLPSSVDWSQSFLESSETNIFQAALFNERPITEHIQVQLGFAETLQDSLRDMNQGFFLSEDWNLSGSAMDDSYFLPPFDFPSNGSLVWNATATSTGSLAPCVINSSNPTEKSNATASRDSYLPTAKKIRIETPSSFPTFKLRKEKLGDRITALQQLVSPFGKTDTASVLHEAIDYIKFLHDQVSGLSNSYPRIGHQRTNQQNILEWQKKEEFAKLDLRSRGLCLVPISSTIEVANDEIPPVDFWTQLWRKL